MSHTHVSVSVSLSRVNPANLLANPSFEQVTSPSGPDGAYLNVPTDYGSTYLTDTRSLTVAVSLPCFSLKGMWQYRRDRFTIGASEIEFTF